MATLPPLGLTPDLANLETFLENSYPGGKKILPTYAEGPFWLVPISDCEKPTWTAATVLAAYPAVAHVPAHDGYDHLTYSLHAVPDFARDALEWDSTEYELTVEIERVSGPYEQMPSWTEIAAELPNFLTTPDASSSIYDTFTNACTHAGPTALLQLLSALDEDILTDPDALETAVRGALTPSSSEAQA